jgi:hypothetical protein
MKQHINFATKHLVILQIKTSYTGLTIWLGLFFSFICDFDGGSVSCVVCVSGLSILDWPFSFLYHVFIKMFQKALKNYKLGFFSSKNQCTSRDKLLPDKNVLFFYNKCMHPLLKMTYVILLLPCVKAILETAASLWI